MGSLVAVGTTLFGISTDDQLLYRLDTTATTPSWTRVSTSTKRFSQLLPFKTALFAVLGNGTTDPELVSLSTDSGATWLPFHTGLVATVDALGSSGANLFALSAGYAYHTPLQ